MVKNMARKFDLLLLAAFVACLMASIYFEPSKANPVEAVNPVSVDLHTVKQAAEFAVEEHNKKKKTHLKLEKVVDAHLIYGVSVHKTHSAELILVIAAKDHGHAPCKYVALVWLDSWPAPKHMKLKHFEKLKN